MQSRADTVTRHGAQLAEHSGAEDELRNLYDLAPLGLCQVDRHLRFVRINDRLAAMHGVSPAAHIGRTLTELIPELGAAVEPPARRVIETGAPVVDLSYTGVTPADPGVLHTWVATYCPITDHAGEVTGVNVMVQDVTERRGLIETQAEHRAILSALPDLMFLMTPDGVYLDAHVQSESLLLRPPKEFLGRSIFAVLPPDLAQQVATALERVRSHGSSSMDYSVVMRGERRFYEARLVQCGPDRVLSIVRDITDARQSQTEAHLHRLKLAHMSRVTLLAEITASLAHELNQPLTAILSNAQAAEHALGDGSMPPEEHREVLADIVDASQRAGEVIRRLRLWLKRDEFLPESVDVNEMIQRVEHLIRSELIMRRVRLAFDLDASAPRVSADRVQLEQVILNLAMNAIEAIATSEGGDRQIVIRTQASAGNVNVFVRDSGPGIPMEHLDRMFDAFFTTKPSGLGIGLRICASIVKAHGGRIWAENNADAGATIGFSLPAVRRAND